MTPRPSEKLLAIAWEDTKLVSFRRTQLQILLRDGGERVFDFETAEDLAEALTKWAKASPVPKWRSFHHPLLRDFRKGPGNEALRDSPDRRER